LENLRSGYDDAALATFNVSQDPNQQRKQDSMSEQLGVLFLVLFVFAAAGCIHLSITMSRRVQMGINRWRNEERQALETQLKHLADADARMQIERWKQEYEREIRLDAVQRSSAVTRGKVTEHIVPYLPGFDLDPKDIRFLGTPIDLIAFNGLNASVEEIEIVFIEVKTGRSVLSAREKAVKKAVEEKKVSWREFNPDVEIERPTIRITTEGSWIGAEPRS
jgi:predicted Holliday junction resolvase-like endonuclease